MNLDVRLATTMAVLAILDQSALMSGTSHSVTSVAIKATMESVREFLIKAASGKDVIAWTSLMTRILKPGPLQARRP